MPNITDRDTGLSIYITHSCLSRQHDKCTDNNCKCKCGCNNGIPMSNMTSRSRRSSQCARGSHISCIKYSGAACPCDCHSPELHFTKYISLINKYGKVTGICLFGNHANCKVNGCMDDCHINGVTSTVSVSANATTQANVPKSLISSVANNKLNSVWDIICKEVFLGEYDSFFLAEDTVRDALFGELGNEYIIQLFPDTINKFTEKLLEKHLSSIKQDNGSYKLESPFGNIKLFIRYADNNSSRYWSCDFFRWSKNFGLIKNSSLCNILINDKILSLVVRNKIYNPQEVLANGVELATKYGWTIEQESIDILAKLIQANAPLINTHELVVGFRCFNINSNKQLVGAYGVPWKSKELVVDCVGFKEHIKQSESDLDARNGTNSGHGCGIYMFKDPSEALYHYGVKDHETQCIAMCYGYGIIGEFESGYRVEKCKIYKLWIWNDKQRISEQYEFEIGQIISNVKYSDFLYDSEVQQFANRGAK